MCLVMYILSYSTHRPNKPKYRTTLRYGFLITNYLVTVRPPFRTGQVVKLVTEPTLSSVRIIQSLLCSDLLNDYIVYRLSSKF